jgi:hypothetical protein
MGNVRDSLLWGASCCWDSRFSSRSTCAVGSMKVNTLVWLLRIQFLPHRKHVTKLNGLIFLLPRFVLGPLACFTSELIWNYGSYRQSVELLGRGISPVVRPRDKTQDNINTEETRTDIYVSSWIRTHDPSVWKDERSCSQSDRPV